jgi:hypothetical protein
MKRKRKITIISLSLLIILPIVYLVIINPVGHYPYLKKEVAKYNGEGAIKDISLRFIVMPIPGYSITFPPFDLDQPFEHTYTLSNLPALANAGVFLIVESENYFEDEERLKLNSRVELTITDSQSQTALGVDNHLKEMIWMYAHRGVVTGHALYNLDTSFFAPNKHETYKLHIKYSPDKALTGRKGYVFIECGGHL